MKRNQTLLDVLNTFLGLPKTIVMANKTIVRTARKRIEMGEVQVNDHTVRDPGALVQEGDYVRFGCARRNRDHFYVGR